MKLPVDFDTSFFEKNRLSILTILFKEGMVSYNRLKQILKFSDGALYSHLKKLIETGYIDAEKKIQNNSTATIYTMTKKGRGEFSLYLNFLETLVSDLNQTRKRK